MSKFLNEMEDCVPDLRRYARALVRDPHAADDLVQDTLERALVKRSMFQRRGTIRPWLFKIMLNIYRNDAKKNKRQIELLDTHQFEHPAHQPATQELRLECQEVFSAIDQLAEEQKQALLLIASGGLSYQQAASVLKIPMGTFMSRLGRARASLRALMKEKTPVELRRVK